METLLIVLVVLLIVLVAFVAYILLRGQRRSADDEDATKPLMLLQNQLENLARTIDAKLGESHKERHGLLRHSPY